MKIVGPIAALVIVWMLFRNDAALFIQITDLATDWFVARVQEAS